ncbi:hypothetical protein NDU88_002411 [Pleurodeles waltl]|uniref:Uncharacterized protein n=1 Tax=Pleurodeles waltl TaxID=8319 RepID=A0AAV7WRL3_PLEWA|nr:hypothetical protein NDU88_002411 [Pleurodeles waltl]
MAAVAGGDRGTDRPGEVAENLPGKSGDGDPLRSDITKPIPSSLQDTLDKILGAIEESKTTLQREIGQLSVELGLLRADHQKLSDRV